MATPPVPLGQPQEPWPMLRARPRTLFGASLCEEIEELEADVAFI